MIHREAARRALLLPLAGAALLALAASLIALLVYTDGRDRAERSARFRAMTFQDAGLAVVHDDQRGVTCYLAAGTYGRSVSCVPDSALRR